MENCLCSCGKPVVTKSVSITIKRQELLKDVAGYAFVEGDVKKTDDEHDRHQIQDIVEDGNVERVTRVFNLTMAEIRELCYPYTKTDVEDGMAVDDTYVEPEQYVLHLTLPDTFSATTVKYLRELIHELCADRIMADWMSITKPEVAANWEAKAESVRGKIKSALVNRLKRVRIKLNPF